MSSIAPQPQKLRGNGQVPPQRTPCPRREPRGGDRNAPPKGTLLFLTSVSLEASLSSHPRVCPNETPLVH